MKKALCDDIVNKECFSFHVLYLCQCLNMSFQTIHSYTKKYLLVNDTLPHSLEYDHRITLYTDIVQNKLKLSIKKFYFLKIHGGILITGFAILRTIKINFQLKLEVKNLTRPSCHSSYSNNSRKTSISICRKYTSGLQIA